MSTPRHLLVPLVLFAVCASLTATLADPTTATDLPPPAEAEPRPDRPSAHAALTTAYERAALKLLIEEANSVAPLDRNCTLHVRPVTPEAMEKEGKFVPVYFVYWAEGPEGNGSVADVVFCAATQSIIRLHVTRGRYILRKPLPFSELEALAAPRAGGSPKAPPP